MLTNFINLFSEFLLGFQQFMWPDMLYKLPKVPFAKLCAKPNIEMVAEDMLAADERHRQTNPDVSHDMAEILVCSIGNCMLPYKLCTVLCFLFKKIRNCTIA